MHCSLRLIQHASVIRRIRSPQDTSPFSSTLRVHQMGRQSRLTKRPTCTSCSKPMVTCLCNRLKTPPLHNSVAVTILQHNLEKKHPLNSARIATLGLKNVDLVTVSDVNFQARFFVRLLDVFDEMPSEGESSERGYFGGGKMREKCDGDAILSLRSSTLDEVMLDGDSKNDVTNDDLEAFECLNSAAINFTIYKYGVIMSFDQNWAAINKWREVKFDELLLSNVAVDDLRKGFAVKKLQNKPVDGSNKYVESEEFEITVPPGSILLFPSEESVAVEALTFEVKNLILLDGTWAKAKRMYNENPWLKFLPHIRLDIKELSLFAEVRHQPKTEYLSTIESIVYALKGVGEESDGLDGLLDVFQEMVGHQRRSKDERVNRVT